MNLNLLFRFLLLHILMIDTCFRHEVFHTIITTKKDLYNRHANFCRRTSSHNR